MTSQDVKGVIQYVESSALKPDKYLNLRATEIMARLPGVAITSDLFPRLLTELDGFQGDPNMLAAIGAHVEHNFTGEVDFKNTKCEQVSYDEAGLIGIKFDNQMLSAVVIQPNDDGDGLCRIQAVANGVRHEYKMVEGQLLHGFHTPLPVDSRTYQLLAHLGVDVANTEK